MVSSIVFQTHLGQVRVFGRGEGVKSNFEFNSFQPFVGLISYEFNGNLAAMGAYEDDCVNAPAKRPFGFTDFNIQSMEEVKGTTSVASVTWVNEEHGTSTKEVMMLD